VKPPKPTTVATVGNVPTTALKQDDYKAIPYDTLHKTRADFRTIEFLKLIQQKGYHLTWRKAILCPCVSPQTDQPRVDCPTCDSSGFFYVEPINIQGVMTGLELRKDVYRNLGEWLEGSSVVTTAPEVRLGYRDSVEMTHSVMTFNEWITKGNRRGIRSRMPDGQDVCRYRVVNMLHLVMDVNGVPLVLEQGTHFVINRSGWIQWTPQGDSLVDDGTVLSAHYEFHPVWIVVSHGHVVRDQVLKIKSPAPASTALPLQAAVKLDYLLDSKTLPSSAVTAEVTGAIA
jgi:hypothetical protein